jgi:hypothetical protein
MRHPTKADRWRRITGALLLSAGLAGCGLLERIFDPVDDEAPRLVSLEPKFPSLAVGESLELRARVVGEPDGAHQFELREDSAGAIVLLVPLDGSRALVRGVAPGQATVYARLDEKSEGLAVVSVR